MLLVYFIQLFPSATINVKLCPSTPPPQSKSTTLKPKLADTAGDYIAQTTSNHLYITDTTGKPLFDIMFQGHIRQAFFVGRHDYLLVIVKHE